MNVVTLQHLLEGGVEELGALVRLQHSASSARRQDSLECVRHVPAGLAEQRLHPGLLREHVDARQQVAMRVVVARNVRQIDDITLLEVVDSFRIRLATRKPLSLLFVQRVGVQLGEKLRRFCHTAR